MPSSNAPSGGFSLFPNTNATKTPPKKTNTRPRITTPQSLELDHGVSFEMTPPRNGRQTPDDMAQFVIDGSPQTAAGPSHRPEEFHEGAFVSQPVPLADAPPRTDTAFSGASTLVRSNSNRSRSSIAKRPLDEAPSSLPAAEAGVRSMFPQYDHNLPFDRQDYFPTQTSPRHIPRTVISRQSHVPQESDNRSPPVRSPVRSPLSAGSAQRWPRRHHEPPVIPPVSTTEELRNYWKAANGWKASSSEGRTFCMKLVPEKDTPIYNLTSTAQTFYHLRFNPTSASAYVTLSRHDPSKPYKERDPAADAAKSPGGILAALREAEKNKSWQESISTTLEEPSRRLPPNDGLVALLYPCAATKMALERPDDMQAVMTAERECARLVWDEDSQNYFLVHPALATPFCITVERNHGWSRTEYTLEHIESPQHLAKLTRDGTGEGWMELDTLIAGRIESHYILDVAVCALLIVANADEKNSLVEQFEPPPVLAPQPAHLRSGSRSRSSSRISNISNIISGGDKKKGKKNRKHRKLEELEMDLESQTSSLGGKLDISTKDKDKLPGTARTVLKLLSFAFKCFIWALTLVFKALMAVVVGLTKCLTSEKL
ncbi:uncharacterized protein BCR38DRAFT_354994 [Pseudomassariella vexata]|uniref:Acetylserotonin methytransferase-like protein n=1 Tax=Pseudomassariella vexata TaxID=1141098 RepID=A0A1Y2DD64_9PEZI|nr:uncharacterized protein BCR38DRAFT_354994 [Pseudomassariella vexata]ORY57223.1 hypothetical protein BCR38DRAFT_354994 [Pseudomassariella vexata]